MVGLRLEFHAVLVLGSEAVGGAQHPLAVRRSTVDGSRRPSHGFREVPDEEACRGRDDLHAEPGSVGVGPAGAQTMRVAELPGPTGVTTVQFRTLLKPSPEPLRAVTDLGQRVTRHHRS